MAKLGIHQNDTVTTIKNRTHMICSTCGSTDVRTDAFGAWDADAGEWVLHSFYDDKSCENCETGITLLEINEATQLEIQAFGMVPDGDGSRLATDHETPEYFSVLLSTTPLENGNILTLEEHDDLSSEEAASVLAALVVEYPAAPVSTNNCGQLPEVGQ